MFKYAVKGLCGTFAQSFVYVSFASLIAMLGGFSMTWRLFWVGVAITSLVLHVGYSLMMTKSTADKLNRKY